MGKFTSGELGDSSLTLRDLEMIRKSFVHILEGYFHTRIEYPKLAAARGARMQTGGRRRRAAAPKRKAPWSVTDGRSRRLRRSRPALEAPVAVLREGARGGRASRLGDLACCSATTRG